MKTRRYARIHRPFACTGIFLNLVIVAVAVGQDAPAAHTPDSTISGYIEVENGRLFYEMRGEGQPIVLVHDGMLHRETWDSQFVDFSRDHRVIRYDRRGYGRSAPGTQRYSNVEDLRMVLDQLKIDRAIIMGISAGGGLVMDFTLKYPERVSTIVLVGAVISGLPYNEHIYTRGGRYTAADMASLEAMIDYWVDKDPFEFAPGSSAAKQRARELLNENPQDLGSHGAQEIGPDRPALGNLSEIKIPTLVIVGESDIADVHAHAGVIQTGITGAERKVITGAGHLVHMEQPETFNREVRLFLNSADFFKTLRVSGIDAAVDLFHRLRAATPDVVLFGEARMNTMAYERLQQGDFQSALKLFQLNVEAYPSSFNVYDSYGEALLANGDTTRAVENYKKSLELNANNTNAVNVLQRLGIQ